MKALVVEEVSILILEFRRTFVFSAIPTAVLRVILVAFVKTTGVVAMLRPWSVADPTEFMRTGSAGQRDKAEGRMETQHSNAK